MSRTQHQGLQNFPSNFFSDYIIKQCGPIRATPGWNQAQLKVLKVYNFETLEYNELIWKGVYKWYQLIEIEKVMTMIGCLLMLKQRWGCNKDLKFADPDLSAEHSITECRSGLKF